MIQWVKKAFGVKARKTEWQKICEMVLRIAKKDDLGGIFYFCEVMWSNGGT